MDLDRWVHDGWEDCDGTCGWEVLEGDARVVQTYHQAEHALQLLGPRAVVRRSLDPAARPCSGDECGMTFALVTSCWDDATDAGAPRLAVQAVYRDAAGAEVPAAIALDCTTAGGTLRFCQGELELGLPDPGGGDAWPPVALVLESSLDGCVVDDVVIESFWVFCGA
jgi:hypothetical protein